MKHCEKVEDKKKKKSMTFKASTINDEEDGEENESDENGDITLIISSKNSCRVKILKVEDFHLEEMSKRRKSHQMETKKTKKRR